MTEMKHRSEIIYLYDIRDANPNGDPLDENKPRIDEERGTSRVTDVRLKRTVRDYLYQRGFEIFVREIMADDKGHIQDGKMRAANFNNDPDKIIRECIDIRLFGGVIPLDKDSITRTGPVQFNMGRSLHRVHMYRVKGTGAFASKQGSLQATFRGEYFLDYALIGFHGVVNENAANDTHLTEEDVQLLLEAMWNGTKNLISRTKVGQMPRLLVKVNYSKPNYHIGDLDKLIKLVSAIPDENIRDVTDFQLDVSQLIIKLTAEKANIFDIEVCVDDRLRIMGEPLASIGVPIKQLEF